MTHRTMRSALPTCLSVDAAVKAGGDSGVGGEALIVYYVRWPIVSLAKIADTYHAWRGEKISPSPPAGEGRGEG